MLNLVSGWRDSNPQSSAPKADMLTLTLHLKKIKNYTLRVARIFMPLWEVNLLESIPENSRLVDKPRTAAFTIEVSGVSKTKQTLGTLFIDKNFETCFPAKSAADVVALREPL